MNVARTVYCVQTMPWFNIKHNNWIYLRWWRPGQKFNESNRIQAILRITVDGLMGHWAKLIMISPVFGNSLVYRAKLCTIARNMHADYWGRHCGSVVRAVAVGTECPSQGLKNLPLKSQQQIGTQHLPALGKEKYSLPPPHGHWLWKQPFS